MLISLLGASNPYGVAGMPSRGGELFQDKTFAFFYQNWLGVHGLLKQDPRTLQHSAQITPQGRSVAKMLLATRWPGREGFYPDEEVMLFTGGRVDEVDRTSFERGDEDVANTKYAFVRERIGRQPSICLVQQDASLRMPLVRALRAQTFPDERRRDAYHVWMSGRVERWNA